MRNDFYNDLKKVAYVLGIKLNNLTIVKRGNTEAGDFKIMALTGRVPLPVNILTLKYEKGALRSITRDLTITKGKDEVTNLYDTEDYTQEWRFEYKNKKKIIH